MERMTTVAGLLLIACGLLGAVAPPDTGYLAPGLESTGGMRHLCLLYHGQARRGPWTAETLRPYVACVDARGKPTDWLFDSFLFIEFATDDDKQLHYFAKDKPQPTMAEWQWLADAWFRPGSGLAGLEACVAETGQTLGQPDHRVGVMITLPCPPNVKTEFGTLPGTERALDFSKEEDRQAALRWYMDTVRKRFEDGHYAHLNLLGFYWTGESIPNEDAALVRWTSDHLHGQGLKHYWIPYFTGQGAGEWRALGFDAMMLQPNYFFDGDGGLGRLGRAADRAKRFGCGVEMEFDGRALTSDVHLQRFWDYLDAGALYGWMDGALVGWYEGGGALGALLKQPDKYRPLYDAVCQFVKGTYTPRQPERFPPAAAMPSRQQDNLALASKGAKVTGAINDGNPGLAPERMLDGDADNYSGSSGLTWFAIPGSVTVELPQPANVARTQMLLFDLDDRYYAYRIDTSPDGQNWEPAVDKSTTEARGWQVDTFPPRTAKYIRLTGIRNSTGQNLVQVVEFEAYEEERRGMKMRTPLLSPDDMAFLTGMAKATLESSRVAPGAMVGKIGPNTSGGTLIRPGGREDYPAFWIRDYAMSVECGIIPAEEQLHALRYTAAHQIDQETALPTGSVLPAGSIADHISFGGVPIFFPGILEDYDKQGGPQWGILPSLDDHFYFVRMAALYLKATGSPDFLKEDINGRKLIDRLEAAYAMPPSDRETGLVRVDEQNRGVNFGFFDCVTHTGDLFFASVLKYRAAQDLAVLFDTLGRAEQAKIYRDNAARLRDTMPKRFPADRGILRASTGLSAQPDVWGTAFAVYAGALPAEEEKAACEGLAAALRNGTIAWKGGIRHVPTDADFSGKSAWEKALAKKNTYQNGAYWDTPTGWVCFAVAKVDHGAAAALANDLVNELRAGDFRKGEDFGSPWECFHPDGNHRQNPIYLASVTAPLDVFLRMAER